MIDLVQDNARLEAGGLNLMRLPILILVRHPNRFGSRHHPHPVGHREAPLAAERLAFGADDARIGHVEQAVILAGTLALPAIDDDQADILAHLRRSNADTAGSGEHGRLQLLESIDKRGIEAVDRLCLAAQALVRMPQNLNGS